MNFLHHSESLNTDFKIELTESTHRVSFRWFATWGRRVSDSPTPVPVLSQDDVEKEMEKSLAPEEGRSFQLFREYRTKAESLAVRKLRMKYLQGFPEARIQKKTV